MDPERTNWLLLRGLSREKRHWGSFPEQLAEAVGTRVLCLDLPGFGTEHERSSPSSLASIADDVRRRFAVERGPDRWAILGISLGGMVALDWCARYPEDFARCVTINTSARPSSPLDRFRLAGLRTVVTTLLSDASTTERALLRITSRAASSELDALVRQHSEWLRECPPRRANRASQLRAAIGFKVPAEVKTPLLVLASTTDQLVSHRCSERIASQLGARLETHDRGGHDLPLDEPDWICAQITRWVTTGAGA